MKIYLIAALCLVTVASGFSLRKKGPGPTEDPEGPKGPELSKPVLECLERKFEEEQLTDSLSDADWMEILEECEKEVIFEKCLDRKFEEEPFTDSLSDEDWMGIFDECEKEAEKPKDEEDCTGKGKGRGCGEPGEDDTKTRALKNLLIEARKSKKDGKGKGNGKGRGQGCEKVDDFVQCMKDEAEKREFTGADEVKDAIEKCKMDAAPAPTADSDGPPPTDAAPAPTASSDGLPPPAEKRRMLLRSLLKALVTNK